MRDKRPVNLDPGTIHLPLAAWTSIIHRISGVIVFVGIAFLLWALDTSLSSERGFDNLRAAISSPVGKFIAWGILTALAYHLIAGCKHLLLDMGIGESKEGGPQGAKLVIMFSAMMAVLIGGWLW